MKSFSLYVYKDNQYRILLTKHDNIEPIKTPSLYSTFDENLNVAENDQLTLTFSMLKWVDRIEALPTKSGMQISKRIENQFHKLLQFGTRLELVIDDKDKYIFVINQIKPTVTKDNVKYDYTCQDEVSFTWSRRSIGMSYSTVEEGGTQTIYEIVDRVFQRANIWEWKVKADEKNESQSRDGKFLSKKKITLEVEDSNP